MDPQPESTLRDELASMKKKVEALEFQNLLQKDEIRALNIRGQTHQDELKSLSTQLHTLTSQATQDTPFTTIGQEVRLRFLENHRQRMMRRNVGALGRDRIKRGDRAAHRGRPIPDALLCLSGAITDREVYQDLYGVSAEIVKEYRDVPEVIEVVGFRGSLQSEGWLTGEFQRDFERLRGIASGCRSPGELRGAFGEDGGLQRLHEALQVRYDEIRTAHSR